MSSKAVYSVLGSAISLPPEPKQRREHLEKLCALSVSAHRILISLEGIHLKYLLQFKIEELSLHAIGAEQTPITQKQPFLSSGNGYPLGGEE